jgi:hypothetical protein
MRVGGAKGISIDNAWTDPLTQVKHAIDMAHNNGYHLTLLTPGETEQLQRDIDECLVAFPAVCLPVHTANRTLCEQVDGECYKKIFRSTATETGSTSAVFVRMANAVAARIPGLRENNCVTVIAKYTV